jgi:hypothetical protein
MHHIFSTNDEAGNKKKQPSNGMWQWLIRYTNVISDISAIYLLFRALALFPSSRIDSAADATTIFRW